jgi:transcriptional regulator with XRE-family HTH domain
MIRNSLEELLTHTGQRLKTARKQKGMTQGELAKRLGVAQNTISRYELGNKSITLSTLYEIAQTLEIPISYFFEMLSDETVANEFDALDERLREMAREIIRSLLQEQEQLIQNPCVGEEKQIVVTVSVDSCKSSEPKSEPTQLSYREIGGKSNDLSWSVRTSMRSKPSLHSNQRSPSVDA